VKVPSSLAHLRETYEPLLDLLPDPFDVDQIVPYCQALGDHRQRPLDAVPYDPADPTFASALQAVSGISSCSATGFTVARKTHETIYFDRTLDPVLKCLTVFHELGHVFNNDLVDAQDPDALNARRHELADEAAPTWAKLGFQETAVRYLGRGSVRDEREFLAEQVGQMFVRYLAERDLRRLAGTQPTVRAVGSSLVGPFGGWRA
jgi:hypothetical protein